MENCLAFDTSLIAHILKNKILQVADLLQAICMCIEVSVFRIVESLNDVINRPSPSHSQARPKNLIYSNSRQWERSALFYATNKDIIKIEHI